MISGGTASRRSSVAAAWASCTARATCGSVGVIPIYEAGDVAGQLCIAMRYVDGIDLERLLAAEGALAPERALALVAQLAAALDAA